MTHKQINLTKTFWHTDVAHNSFIWSHLIGHSKKFKLNWCFQCNCVKNFLKTICGFQQKAAKFPRPLYKIFYSIRCESHRCINLWYSTLRLTIHSLGLTFTNLAYLCSQNPHVLCKSSIIVHPKWTKNQRVTIILTNAWTLNVFHNSPVIYKIAIYAVLQNSHKE